MVTLTYYPGCSLKTGSKFYETSIRKVFYNYGIELKELHDWSCCGASAAHTVDEEAAHVLVARNLAIAEKEELNFFAPCSACYSRSKITNETIRTDAALQDEMNSAIAPLECTGSIEVKNIVEVLDDHVGVSAIAAKRKFDLSGLEGRALLRVRPYAAHAGEAVRRQGRPARAWTGCSLRWARTSCGGLSRWSAAARQDADGQEYDGPPLGADNGQGDQAGADAIVTPCPLCQMNLDLLPALGSTKPASLPCSCRRYSSLPFTGAWSGMASHFVAADRVLKKIKEA